MVERDGGKGGSNLEIFWRPMIPDNLAILSEYLVTGPLLKLRGIWLPEDFGLNKSNIIETNN